MKHIPQARPGDAALIAQYPPEKIIKLPPSAALALGESTPGWRHNQDFAAEVRYAMSRGLDKEPGINERHRIAERIGAPVVRTHRVHEISRKPMQRYFVVCHFFDKVCLVLGHHTERQAQAQIDYLSDLYGCVGARFFTAIGAPPTEYSWKVTLKPLLTRQLRRLAINRSTAATVQPSNAQTLQTLQTQNSNPHQE